MYLQFAQVVQKETYPIRIDAYDLRLGPDDRAPGGSNPVYDLLVSYQLTTCFGCPSNLLDFQTTPSLCRVASTKKTWVILTDLKG